jgi:hypothetical protein
MTFRVYAVAGLICAGPCASAWAQTAPADLVAAYRAGVAAAKCDLALDSAKSSALGDAVQRIEQRSGLGHNAAYCAKEAGRIDAVISLAK